MKPLTADQRRARQVKMLLHAIGVEIFIHGNALPPRIYNKLERRAALLDIKFCDFTKPPTRQTGKK